MHSAPGTETFGERIRRRRHESRLSQRQLAALVGVDFTYLSKLENDQHGQSPGEELVVKLAEQLHDDSEVLLALAGKVPVEALRTLARQDADFARFLRRLAGVPADDKRERLRQVLESGAEPDVGKLPELLAPLMEKGGLNDTHIVARLSHAPAGDAEPGVLVRIRVDYETRQDEWLWGFVTEWSHRDRLRDRGVSLDDIEVLMPTAVVEKLRADEIVRAYDLLVRYRDGDAPFEEVPLERLTDLSRIWRQLGEVEQFPLAVMRATFPPLADTVRRRIELSYSSWAPRQEGYWFWMASSPTYVATIAVDARQIATDRHLTFTAALPNFVGRQEGVDGMYSVRVDRWVLPGHGVTLDWRPADAGRRAV